MSFFHCQKIGTGCYVTKCTNPSKKKTHIRKKLWMYTACQILALVCVYRQMTHVSFRVRPKGKRKPPPYTGLFSDAREREPTPNGGENMKRKKQGPEIDQTGSKAVVL